MDVLQCKDFTRRGRGKGRFPVRDDAGQSPVLEAVSTCGVDKLQHETHFVLHCVSCCSVHPYCMIHTRCYNTWSCRHDSMDLMWRSGDLGLFGANSQVAWYLCAHVLFMYDCKCTSSYAFLLLSLDLAEAQWQQLHFD